MSSEDPNYLEEAECDERKPAGKSKQILRDLSQYSRDATRRLSEEIKLQSSSILLERKVRAAGQLDTLAEILKEAGQKLRENNGELLAEITDTGVHGMVSLSRYLRERDLNGIAGDVEDFARRQPVVFLSATLAVGFLLGQLLPTSEKRTEEVNVFCSKKESSIEYKPAEGEEAYYERH